MGVAIHALREEGIAIDEAGLSRLSPLGHDHITMLGQHSFNVPESVAQGRLRPLTRPTRRVIPTAFFVPLLTNPHFERQRWPKLTRTTRCWR